MDWFGTFPSTSGAQNGADGEVKLEHEVNDDLRSVQESDSNKAPHG